MCGMDAKNTDTKTVSNSSRLVYISDAGRCQSAYKSSQSALLWNRNRRPTPCAQIIPVEYTENPNLFVLPASTMTHVEHPDSFIRTSAVTLRVVASMLNGRLSRDIYVLYSNFETDTPAKHTKKRMKKRPKKSPNRGRARRRRTLHSQIR